MLISNVDYLFGDFWSTKLGDKPKLYIEEINISLICVLFLYHSIKKIVKAGKTWAFKKNWQANLRKHQKILDKFKFMNFEKYSSKIYFREHTLCIIWYSTHVMWHTHFKISFSIGLFAEIYHNEFYCNKKSADTTIATVFILWLWMSQ